MISQLGYDDWISVKYFILIAWNKERYRHEFETRNNEVAFFSVHSYDTLHLLEREVIQKINKSAKELKLRLEKI
jgi:hypothetical protein